MNYAAFDEMANGTLAQRDGEDEQTYMERVLREVTRNDGFCGPDTPCSIYRINDMLAPEFAACSAADKTLTLSLPVREWMLNPVGTLHGGLMSTMMDMSMGLLSRYYRRTNEVSTVNLTVNYLRAVRPGGTVTAAVRAEKAGRRVIFQTGMLRTGDGKIVLTAAGTFM